MRSIETARRKFLGESIDCLEAIDVCADVEIAAAIGARDAAYEPAADVGVEGLQRDAEGAGGGGGIEVSEGG